MKKHQPLPFPTYDWLTDPLVFKIGQVQATSIRHQELDSQKILLFN